MRADLPLGHKNAPLRKRPTCHFKSKRTQNLKTYSREIHPRSKREIATAVHLLVLIESGEMKMKNCPQTQKCSLRLVDGLQYSQHQQKASEIFAFTRSLNKKKKTDKSKN